MDDIDAEVPSFEVLDSNRWFILGHDDEGYAIWPVDRDDDEPVQTFPDTDHGSELAFDAFVWMTKRARRGRLLVVLLVTAAVSGAAWFVSSAYVSVRFTIGLGSPTGADQRLLEWMQAISQSAYPLFFVSFASFVMVWMLRRGRGGHEPARDECQTASS